MLPRTTVTLALSIACAEGLLTGTLLTPAPRCMHGAFGRTATLRSVRCEAEAGPTPEALLLEALGFLKRNEIDRARSNVLEARRVCDSNGGPTEDQAQLLELLTARLPKSAGRASEPTLNELFPGTVAAPTGQSLVLPGTPEFHGAESAALCT